MRRHFSFTINKQHSLSFFVGSQTQWTTNLFLTILKYASGYEILGQSLANLASKAEEPWKRVTADMHDAGYHSCKLLQFILLYFKPRFLSRLVLSKRWILCDIFHQLLHCIVVMTTVFFFNLIWAKMYCRDKNIWYYIFIKLTF